MARRMREWWSSLPFRPAVQPTGGGADGPHRRRGQAAQTGVAFWQPVGTATSRVASGELQESYNRFTEVSNSGGGSRSCWAIASWEQLSEETRRRRGWRSVADVRETVAASIEGGTRRQRHSRLEYLRYTLDADPDFHKEILEHAQLAGKRGRAELPRSIPCR